MATTRLMPLHIGEGRSFSTAIEDIIDYVENPEKTDYLALFLGRPRLIPARSAGIAFFAFVKRMLPNCQRLHSHLGHILARIVQLMDDTVLNVRVRKYSIDGAGKSSQIVCTFRTIRICGDK